MRDSHDKKIAEAFEALADIALLIEPDLDRAAQEHADAAAQKQTGAASREPAGTASQEPAGTASQEPAGTVQQERVDAALSEGAAPGEASSGSASGKTDGAVLEDVR